MSSPEQLGFGFSLEPSADPEPEKKPQKLRQPVDPELRLVPATVVWRRSIKEAACVPNRAHAKIERPLPSANAPRFEAIYPPRSIRADQRTYRLATSQPRAFAAVRQTLLDNHESTPIPFHARVSP